MVIPLDRIAGWGVYDITDPELTTSFYLMAVNISVIPLDICNGQQSYNGLLPPNVFCAGQVNAAPGMCAVRKFDALTKSHGIILIVVRRLILAAR